MGCTAGDIICVLDSSVHSFPLSQTRLLANIQSAFMEVYSHLLVPVAQLRTSSHPLRIEMGRYNLFMEHTCWFCNNGAIEDKNVNFCLIANCTQTSRSKRISYSTAIH